jgi:2-dehydropantoate 2-reductase
MSLRMAVFGAGGIGGVIGGGAQADALCFITGNDTITDAIRAHGLHTTLHDGTQLHTKPDATTHASGAAARGRFDVAVLAVPPNRTHEAAQAALTLLHDQGVVVTVANGLPEERLQQAMPALQGRIIGGVVGFGASVVRPGVVEQTSDGAIELGELMPSVGGMLQRLPAALPHVRTESAANLRGARWSKLAVNSAISSLGTIGGDRLGVLMRHRFVRRLCLEVITEVVQVAQREGVRLEKAAGVLDLDWVTLDDSERGLELGSPALFAKHTLLLAVGAKYRRLRSSMLAAIERGRDPPVDFLNGEAVTRGKALGVATPVNERVCEFVWLIARKQRAPHVNTLRELFSSTAHLRGAERE